MKQVCLIAKEFPGLGDPRRLEIDDFVNAIVYAAELHGSKQ